MSKIGGRYLVRLMRFGKLSVLNKTLNYLPSFIEPDDIETLLGQGRYNDIDIIAAESES